MWPYLEIGSLQKSSSESEIIGWAPIQYDSVLIKRSNPDKDTREDQVKDTGRHPVQKGFRVMWLQNQAPPETVPKPQQPGDRPGADPPSRAQEEPALPTP